MSHPARRLAVSAAGAGTAAVGDIGFEYLALGARLFGAGIIGNGHGGGSKAATTLLREKLASGVDRLAWRELSVEDSAYGQSYAQCASRTA